MQIIIFLLYGIAMPITVTPQKGEAMKKGVFCCLRACEAKNLQTLNTLSHVMKYGSRAIFYMTPNSQRHNGM